MRDPRMTVEIGLGGLTRVRVHHDAEARDDAIRWLARLWPALANLDAELRRGRASDVPEEPDDP